MVTGKLHGLTTMFQTIFRTKRRAFSLISGIILGTMILSGIILYSGVLAQNNFESIVGSTAYELKISLLK